MATWGQTTETGAGSESLDYNCWGSVGQFTIAGQRLDSLHFKLSAGVSADDVRAAVYMGDTADPEGMDLFEDLGVVSCGPGWNTWASSSNPAIPQNKYLFLVCKTTSSLVWVLQHTSTDGDLTLNSYRLAASGEPSENPDHNVAFTDPCVDTDLTRSGEVIVCYIIHSSADGSTIPVLAHHYRMLQGVG